MDFSVLKNKFFAYLASDGKQNEIDENSEKTDYSDFSIFKYANEFKSFLKQEYNTVGVKLAGKSISDIMEMEMEYGKIVEYLDDIAKTAEESKTQNSNTEKNVILTDVEEQITDELSNDMSNSEAKTIVDNFEGTISNGVENQILNGEINSFDIFKEIYSDLSENNEFLKAIDVDNSKEIKKNEFENF